MYTGHVTAGGSICLEALTLSGTPGSWQPDFSVESLMNIIMINMVRKACGHLRAGAAAASTRLLAANDASLPRRNELSTAI